MKKLILFNKPYNVVCQFTTDDDSPTLAEFIPIKNVYAAGRLDKDSEGLLLLTDDGALQHQLTDPKHKLPKTYWVQVEGIPDAAALNQLCRGVLLRDGKTLPAKVKIIAEPKLWPRHPPIRFRRDIPTTWLELILVEGKNRQIRRMTAAIGHPTLRLIRVTIGSWQLEQLQPGEWREVKP